MESGAKAKEWRILPEILRNGKDSCHRANPRCRYRRNRHREYCWIHNEGRIPERRTGVTLQLPKAKRKRLPSGHYAFYVDGECVGMVKWTTKGTSIVSALSNQPGPRKWYPTDVNGKALVPALTMCTLRDASRVLLEILAPVQAEVTLNKRSGLMSGSLYWKGHVFWVSRWPSESYWIVDGHIAVGAFAPSFCHGEGTRPGSGRFLEDEECASVLDAAAQGLQ